MYEYKNKTSNDYNRDRKKQRNKREKKNKKKKHANMFNLPVDSNGEYLFIIQCTKQAAFTGFMKWISSWWKVRGVQYTCRYVKKSTS